MRRQLSALFIFMWGYGYAIHSASGAFFSTDTGLRFMLIRQLARGGGFWMAYPSLEHVPLNRAFIWVEGAASIKISPLYPLIGAFFYAWGGWVALTMVAAAGATLSGYLLYRIGLHLQIAHAFWLPSLLIMASPMWLYGATIWDHSWGIATALAGLLAWLKNRPFIAGILLAIAAYQRIELYILIAPIIPLSIGRISMVRLIGGLLVGGAIGCLISLIIYGHPLAPILSGYLSPWGEVVLHRPYSQPRWLKKINLLTTLQGDIRAWWWLGVVVVGVVASWLGFKRLGSVGIMGGSIATLAIYPLAQGLLISFPLLGATEMPAEEDRRRVAWLGVGIFALGLLILPSSGGLQWGARYLLILYPIALLLINPHRKWLIMGAIAIQFWGMVMVGGWLMSQKAGINEAMHQPDFCLHSYDDGLYASIDRPLRRCVE